MSVDDFFNELKERDIAPYTGLPDFCSTDIQEIPGPARVLSTEKSEDGSWELRLGMKRKERGEIIDCTASATFYIPKHTDKQGVTLYYHS